MDSTPLRGFVAAVVVVSAWVGVLLRSRTRNKRGGGNRGIGLELGVHGLAIWHSCGAVLILDIRLAVLIGDLTERGVG